MGARIASRLCAQTGAVGSSSGGPDPPADATDPRGVAGPARTKRIPARRRGLGPRLFAAAEAHRKGRGNSRRAARRTVLRCRCGNPRPSAPAPCPHPDLARSRRPR
eukprot:2031612-Alexandrium_andersonii.AAC.1